MFSSALRKETGWEWSILCRAGYKTVTQINQSIYGIYVHSSVTKAILTQLLQYTCTWIN